MFIVGQTVFARDADGEWRNLGTIAADLSNDEENRYSVRLPDGSLVERDAADLRVEARCHKTSPERKPCAYPMEHTGRHSWELPTERPW